MNYLLKQNTVQHKLRARLTHYRIGKLTFVRTEILGEIARESISLSDQVLSVDALEKLQDEDNDDSVNTEVYDKERGNKSLADELLPDDFIK